MDNPLTPNKIRRLIHLAEDKSFNIPRRLLNDEEVKRFVSEQVAMSKSSTNTNLEVSSGILDLEKVDGFGESGIENISLKSSSFNPGEMTGRSTGAEELPQGYEEYGRHSLALDSLQSNMDKQTMEINDIMRHSIATNYSFHSKRDLTADEASLVMREAPLPVTNSTQLNFEESLSLNHQNMSVGAYFKHRCPEFGRILSNTDSPDRSMQPSLTEVSLSTPIASGKFGSSTFNLDNTLDSVPVKQPKVLNLNPESVTQNLTMNKEVIGKATEKANNSAVNLSSIKSMGPPLINKPLASIIPFKNLPPSLRMVTEDEECSMENSLSLSRIAEYLERQSNISVTDILHLNNKKKQMNRKPPLTELHMNFLENKRINQDVVTNLKDTRNTDTASSSGTVNTVIAMENLKISDENKIPSVLVTQTSEIPIDLDNVKPPRVTRSKSPSSKSQSTLSTVFENKMSFKSGDSPVHSGETRISHIPSPNVGYKELDKSVDWLEVLQQKHANEDCLAKEQWVEIQTTPVNGFVGVSCAIAITISTVTDSWLTAKFNFDDLPNGGQDFAIEMPRLPLLLPPGKTEQFTVHLTSYVEMATKLSFTMHLKDASIDGDMEQKGFLEINIKMPTIQAISCDGVNTISFPTVQEKCALTKYFVLISDCPVDLNLELAIIEGDSVFVIKNVQEIKRSDVSKALMDPKVLEEQQTSKYRGKSLNKQLCRLTTDNAIKVTVIFTSPKLSDLGITDNLATFKGLLNVNLIGVNTVLKKVSILGTVGTANLEVQKPSEKILLSNEPVAVSLTNTGTVRGTWVVKFHSEAFTESNFPFKVYPTKLEIDPGCTTNLNMSYIGAQDVLTDAILILEDVVTGDLDKIEISGGKDQPKICPIKTNFNNMTWVREGRKELSLKNFSQKKVQIRCQILGEGFHIDLPGVESRGVYCLAFGPCECRPLPIVFAPTSNKPQVAALHIVFDKNSDFSRKIMLHGCGGGAALRWAGQVTYGDTALVRALHRRTVDLVLYNKAPAPAFFAASVHFNLTYSCVAGGSSLVGARRVVGGRARAGLTLRLDWARLERRARALPAAHASALATITLIAGPEYTRRRILRILRSESPTGELDVSLLPDHLKVLTEQFDGEDSSMDAHLENFKETKATLNELIESLQELTAQIDLPQEFAEDNTILITDDTVVEHHTICD